MAIIMDSILNTTKKVLGMDESYEAFDTDIVMHINSVFSILHQLGVGPVVGFSIEDATDIWEDYILDVDNINSVKSYMYLKVRLMFDPPATSFAITAMENQAKEFEWRLYVQVDPPPEGD